MHWVSLAAPCIDFCFAGTVPIRWGYAKVSFFLFWSQLQDEWAVIGDLRVVYNVEVRYGFLPVYQHIVGVLKVSQ
ncbi:MAG: hypothetical protein QNJ16_21285 [Rhodobacter sp.]|nr:hypothetical protein [Rhodobacter sp.]